MVQWNFLCVCVIQSPKKLINYHMKFESFLKTLCHLERMQAQKRKLVRG